MLRGRGQNFYGGGYVILCFNNLPIGLYTRPDLINAKLHNKSYSRTKTTDLSAK